MNSLKKFLLSSHLIKRAYAGYMPFLTGNARPSAPPAPKAIPISSGKLLNSPTVSAVNSDLPVPKAIPISAAKILTPQTQAPANTPISPYQPILDIIRKGEANVAGYETMVGSKKPYGLTKKTLQQILDLQAAHKKTHGGTAAGAYQILNNNLINLAKKHNHDLNKTLFDQATQDIYAKTLMDRRGFQDYLKGKISADQMRINLAKEWAALPARGELSYYQGEGTNRATVLSRDVNSAIAKALELYKKSLRSNSQ